LKVKKLALNYKCLFNVTGLPARAVEAVPKIPVFDIVSCELYVNPKKLYSAEKYFKMVISIPDETESPAYGCFIRTYTESAFSTSKDSRAVKPVRNS
jgi:hypothetical protein